MKEVKQGAAEGDVVDIAVGEGEEEEDGGGLKGVGEVGLSALSMHSGWRLTELEAALPTISENGGSEYKNGTCLVFLYTIGNTLDDIIYDGLVVPIRLVISKPHHAPAFLGNVPTHFDYSFVELFT